MKKVSVRLELDVTLSIPDEVAAKITPDDVREMAGSVCCHHHAGLGIQATVDGVAQFEDDARKHPLFCDADVDGWLDDGEIEICDDGFDLLEKAEKEAS